MSRHEHEADLRTTRKCAHIGIVACSAEGAALCYRTICAEGSQRLGPHAHPEVSMHTPSFADYVRRIDADDWDGVAELMLGSARRLAGAGAQFLICPDNTIHRALPAVVDRSPLLWLDMPEVVVLEARLRGFRRVGLTGTRWLVESDVYPTRSAAAGVELVRPERAEIDELHRIIMDELVCGVFRRQSVAYVRQVIARMKRAGCDAVILGCTELPLIVDDRSSPLPTLDSTRLLARAALDHAVSVRVEAGHGPRG